jgi:hypothetical protein
MVKKPKNSARKILFRKFILIDKAGFNRIAVMYDKKEKTRLMLKPYISNFAADAAWLTSCALLPVRFKEINANRRMPLKFNISNTMP